MRFQDFKGVFGQALFEYVIGDRFSRDGFPIVIEFFFSDGVDRGSLTRGTQYFTHV
jgi:hypothetical protein